MAANSTDDEQNRCTEDDEIALPSATDDLLAALAAMGFDISECKPALQRSNVTLQEAVEIILQARQNRESGIFEESSHQSRVDTHQSHVHATQQNVTVSHQPSGSGPNLDDVRKDHQGPVSRYVMNENQKRMKEQFVKKEREEIDKDVKRRRLLEKNAKKAVLKEIEADKQRRHELKSSLVNIEPLSTNADLKDDKEPSVEKPTDQLFCRIQVRLPSGKSFARLFPSISPLQDVLEFALEQATQNQILNPALVQPFPRHEFGPDELCTSLSELHLSPGASLVLISGSANDQKGTSNINLPLTTDKTTTGLAPGFVATNIHTIESPPDQPTECHAWGFGHKMSSSVQTSNTDVENEKDVSNELSSLRTEMGNIPSAPGCSSADLQEHVEERNHDVDAMREAAELRMHQQQRNDHCKCTGRPLTTRSNPPMFLTAVDRDISTLQKLCAACIARNLVGQNGHIVSSLSGLSQKAAHQVIQKLKEKKLLCGKLLQFFLPCKLQHLDLDAYSRTTNELLESSRLHSSLTCLSLVSGSLVTDQGIITATRGLKHLRALNLNGCSQLTDKSLHTISELPCLYSLKMDDTKIKSDGVFQFLSNCKTTDLTELSFNGTQISDQAFVSSRVFPTLLSLDIDRTQVASLNFLSLFENLRHLSVASTPLVAESIEALGRIKNLEELNLNQTQITNDDLSHLIGLPLRSVGLPDRLLITDDALKYIRDLPLTTLDLGDYINITDEGLLHIGNIKTLTSLTLSNTKITDSGMGCLTGLCYLQELDLGKTRIGDMGVGILKGLKNIETLSLSSTMITDDCFVNGSVNAYKSLFKLNLSRTAVSDNGLRKMVLPSLQMLNIDQTRASSLFMEYLSGCPNLKTVRAKNCIPPED